MSDLSPSARRCKHVFIRHGPKQQISEGYRLRYFLDPNLTREGFGFTRRSAEKLIRECGRPDLIVCSPYLRTRMTAELISESCGGVPVVICRELSEYVGPYHRDPSKKVDRVTRSHDPPFGESEGQFRSRCDRYLRSIRSEHEGFNCVYHVTHRYFVANVAIEGSRVELRDIPYCGYHIVHV